MLIRPRVFVNKFLFLFFFLLTILNFLFLFLKKTQFPLIPTALSKTSREKKITSWSPPIRLTLYKISAELFQVHRCLFHRHFRQWRLHDNTQPCFLLFQATLWITLNSVIFFPLERYSPMGPAVLRLLRPLDWSNTSHVSPQSLSQSDFWIVNRSPVTNCTTRPTFGSRDSTMRLSPGG